MNLWEAPEKNGQCTRCICNPFAVPHLINVLPTPLQSERQVHPAMSIALATASEDTDELFAHSLVETEHLGERAVIQLLVRKACSRFWYAKRPLTEC